MLDLGAIVVCRPSNVDYLTGFDTFTWGLFPAIVTEDRVGLCLPDAEVPLALTASCVNEVAHYDARRAAAEVLPGYLEETFGPGARIGLDACGGFVPSNLWTAINERGLVAVDIGSTIEELRLILSPAEQTCIRTAAMQTAKGLEAAVSAAQVGGAHDADIASATFAALTDGADSLVRAQIAVAAGWRSSVTHASWRNDPLEDDAVVFLEFAGSCHNYCAPIIRTLVKGTPTTRIRQLSELSERVLGSVLETLRPGVLASEVARSGWKRLGWLSDEVFFHGNFGYPVGLAQRTSWVDGARFYLTNENDREVVPGMAFHIPAAMLHTGRCGVGHSQTVLVNDEGLEVVTSSCGNARLIHV